MRTPSVHHTIPNWLLLTSVYLFGAASFVLIEHAVPWRAIGGEAPAVDLLAGTLAPEDAVLPSGFEKLDLTKAQLYRMGNVMLRTRQRIDSVSGAVVPSIQAIWHSQQQSLQCLLTKQQRSLYSKIDPVAYRTSVGSGLRCDATATE